MEWACLKDATAVVKQKPAHGAKPTREFTDLTTNHFILQNTGCANEIHSFAAIVVIDIRRLISENATRTSQNGIQFRESKLT